MHPEPKKIWIEALESKKYVQARQAFSDWRPDDRGNPTNVVEHCCLAVLAHEAATRDVPGIRWRDGEVQPEIVVAYNAEDGEWYQVRDHIPELVETGTEVVWKQRDKLTAVYPDRPRSDNLWAWAPADEFTGAMLPACVVEWAGLEGENPQIGSMRAAAWNDEQEASFPEIAYQVAEHL